MRKQFSLVMLLVLIAFAFMLMLPGPVFAKSLFYASNPSQVSGGIGDLYLAGTQAITGQCNLQSLTISGVGTTAKDYVLLYDNTSATGTPKFEVGIGVAGDTVTVPLNDAEFGTGVFAKTNSNDVFVSIEYTQ